MRPPSALVIAGFLLCVAAQAGGWGIGAPLAGPLLIVLLVFALRHRDSPWTDVLIVSLLIGALTCNAPGIGPLAASALGLLLIHQGSAMAASESPGASVSPRALRIQLAGLGVTLVLTLACGALAWWWNPAWLAPAAMPVVAAACIVIVGLIGLTVATETDAPAGTSLVVPGTTQERHRSFFVHADRAGGPDERGDGAVDL